MDRYLISQRDKAIKKKSCVGVLCDLWVINKLLLIASVCCDVNLVLIIIHSDKLLGLPADEIIDQNTKISHRDSFTMKCGPMRFVSRVTQIKR